MVITDELLSAYSKLALCEANEAETRLKIIDRILFEVLGWTRDDVSVEERVSEDGSSTYADYIVRTAGSAFVIEAKKLGAAFSVVPDSRRHRLSGSIMQGVTGATILQAREYCRRKSIAFAVVTNGAQWVIFPAVRIDQVPFADSSAIIFPTLVSALRDDYSEFVHLLCRDDVIAGSLETELLGRSEDQLGQRRLKTFFTNRGVAPARNPLYPLIEHAVITAFTDSIVDNSPDLLEKCYVHTPERIKFDRQINMHISKRQPVFGRAPIRPMQRKQADDVRKVIEVAQSVARPVAILVLGTVGAGKTTFLHYTRNVSSSSFFKSDNTGPYPHWIYADFRKFLPSENISQFLYGVLREYINNDWFLSNFEQCVRPAYREQIRSLREGPLKLLSGFEDKINERIADYLLEQTKLTDYLDRILKYASTKAPIFLVIDNVDQLESLQDEATIFAESIALAHKNALNLVLCLRDATFVKHRSSPTFDAYDFETIAIDAPAIPAVLSRRFFLMKQLLAGRSGEFIAENGARIEVADVSQISDLISSSVLGTNIGTIIDVLATSDVRLALRMTREFLESGYSNPGRALNVYRSTGKYQLPRHEALRSVMLGNHPVYSEAYSIIGNPFDARLSRNTHQLLRLFILTALVTMSSRGDFQYADGSDIRTALRELGFGDAAIKKVLVDLCRMRFVFTGAHGEPELTSSYYPSRLGGYVVRYLIADLTFLEAVMMDTFIPDQSVWEELRSISEAIEAESAVFRRLKLRHARIGKFYAYMQGLYRSLLNEARRRALPNDWCEEPFANAAAQLRKNAKRAEVSAARYYPSN
jgi:hypothetical protein